MAWEAGLHLALRVTNSGVELLELIVEPWGWQYRLKPGDVFVVRTVGSARGEPFPGTTRSDEPFEVDHRPGSMTVHTNGVWAQVTDTHGVEVVPGG